MLPRKFIAFAGPHDEHKWDNGYPLLAPEDYFEYFKAGGVTDIVRLNNPLFVTPTPHRIVLVVVAVGDEIEVACWSLLRLLS